MEIILLFLHDYAILIFIGLFVIFAFAFRKYRKSISEKKEALFGLEKEVSKRNRTAALSALWLVSFLLAGEFLLVFFVLPSFPSLQSIPYPTEAAISLPASTIPPEILATIVAQTPGQTFTPATSSCIPGLIMITAPSAGEQIRGKITLTGTASIPNFGFYKYEFSISGREDWITIQAGRDIVINGSLGDWDTSEITPGDYLLRLVVLDNQGQIYPACEIPIRIVQP